MKQEKINSLTNRYKSEGLTDRRIKNRLKKDIESEDMERNQKHVKEMTITIEWKKSKYYGYCPSASVDVYYKDGTYKHDSGYYAGGCGYDKESTVISEIFSNFLIYKLWDMEDDLEKQGQAPYGIYFGDYPCYSYGIGTDCYYKISEFIGGKLEHISDTKTSDVYKFTNDVINEKLLEGFTDSEEYQNAVYLYLKRNNKIK